jgi:propionyl-CoA synthetase
MKKMADGVEYGVPATIDDPAILGEIGDSLKSLGYPRGQVLHSDISTRSATP